MGLRLLLRSPFIVLGSMVMAFTIDFKCALVFAVAIPFLFLVVFVIMFLSIPLFKKVQGKLDTVTGLTRENLTGVRVIRAFCREKEAVAEFDTRNQELTKLNLFVGKLSALLNPVTYVTDQHCYCYSDPESRSRSKSWRYAAGTGCCPL
mgnify:CR=1 FL=1